jgi:hypothetical protein
VTINPGPTLYITICDIVIKVAIIFHFGNQNFILLNPIVFIFAFLIFARCKNQ